MGSWCHSFPFSFIRLEIESFYYITETSSAIKRSHYSEGESAVSYLGRRVKTQQEIDGDVLFWKQDHLQRVIFYENGKVWLQVRIFTWINEPSWWTTKLETFIISLQFVCRLLLPARRHCLTDPTLPSVVCRRTSTNHISLLCLATARLSTTWKLSTCWGNVSNIWIENLAVSNFIFGRCHQIQNGIVCYSWKKSSGKFKGLAVLDCISYLRIARRNVILGSLCLDFEKVNESLTRNDLGDLLKH